MAYLEIIETTNTKITDPLLLLNNGNSGGSDLDSGIMVERGSAGNNAVFYWNEGDDVFKAVVTATSAGSNNAIADTAMAKIRVAEPAHSSDAATKNYVDSQVAGGGFNISFRGDDSTVVAVASGNTVDIAGGDNIRTVASEPDTVTVHLGTTLTNISYPLFSLSLPTNKICFFFLL